MPYSDKFVVQCLGELLKKYEVEHIVCSPGSRNAPIMAHLSACKEFKTLSIVDERSAAFFALGIAQQTLKPVVITCTSGSAVANYYPAITEAFYQNIPLIVVSADRPLSYVDKFDGQTIRQHKLLKQHCYKSISIEEFEDKKVIEKKLEKAIFKAIQKKGPIQINLSLDEPLYNYVEEILYKPNLIKLVKEKKLFSIKKTKELADKWNKTTKKLVLVGLLFPSKKIEELIGSLSNDNSVVVLTETTSNITNNRFFSNTDGLFYSMNEADFEQFKPDLLLTIGQNIISKRIKSFLRRYPPKEHWHLDEYWQPDTYNALTHKIKTNKQDFLENFLPHITPTESNYFNSWQLIKEKRSIQHSNFLSKTTFSDLKSFQIIFDLMPKDYMLQLANSTVVRYAQLFESANKNNVFSNRGTSGIDGSTSTALGASFATNRKMLFITGDLSFLYDSNALWNNYINNKVRIIVINNGGGNIFKFIPGPDKSNILEKHFEHAHTIKMNYLAKMYGFSYKEVNSKETLIDFLPKFFNYSTKPKILEINTSKIENAQILRNYFKLLV